MSVIGSNILAGASGQAGYFLTKSLRFRQSASARLTRTPASASNRKTYTISAWVKLGSNASSDVGTIFCGGDSSTSTSTHMYFYLNCLRFYFGGAGGPEWITSQVFRDYSSWYHIVAAVDTTQATFGNRLKLYINGTEVTSWSAQGTGGNTALNSDTQINNSVGHGIGSNGAAVQYLYDGYMAEFNFIDGLQLTPSYFGETSTSTGVWIPKKYTGTYGTNGFYLPFTDTTSTSTLGTDFSGNSNTWTVNNISLTAGSTYDSMTDVPTNTSATVANYCVLNPLQLPSAATTTTSNGNLQLNTNSGSSFNSFANGTIFVTTGKWYAEFTQISGTRVFAGISRFTDISTPNSWNSSSTYYINTGEIQKDGSTVTTGATWTNGDVIGVAYDADAATCAFYKNNSLQGTVTGVTAGTYSFSVNGYQSGVIAANFGQQPFTYTPPANFVALNTFNLPTPTIGATASSQANEYFDATLYTGNGGTLAVTNSGSMQPDFVWLKSRSAAYDHLLFDSIRGTGKALFSSSTAGETTTNNMSAFNSNGFTALYDATYIGSNNSGVTMVGWQWRASNTTAVTNTAGSITSTVSANTTAGFSVVTWTGNGTSGATVGHGLGVTPSMVILKSRSSATNWQVKHSSLNANQNLTLNTTDAVDTAPGSGYVSAISSSTLTLLNGGSSIVNVNGSGDTYVAYCFAQIAGYSAIGSYVGNDSADGTFIYTGFRPAFILYKKATGIDGWVIFDTKRNTYNVVDASLQPNTSGAEASSAAGSLDIVSNGFKQRNANNIANSSSFTYIYMAFAENPFKYANAR